MAGKTLSQIAKFNPALPVVNHLVDEFGEIIGWQHSNGYITMLPAGNSGGGAEDGITALAGGGQGGANGELNYRNYRVATVASAGDSVTLPFGIPGMRMTIQNAAGVNSMNVFPATGDKINAVAVNGAFAMAALKTAEFVCTKLGQWVTNPTVAT